MATTVRKHWAFQLVLALAAVVPAVVANYNATGTAKEKSQEVKDKGEAGYQPTKAALLELQVWSKAYQEKIVKLEADVLTLKRTTRNQQLTAARRRKEEQEAAALAEQVKAKTPPPPSTPLPGDLDKALAAQQAAQKAPQP